MSLIFGFSVHISHLPAAFAVDKKNIVGTIEWFNGQGRNYCATPPPGSPVKSASMPQAEPPPAGKQALPDETFKSESQLKRYLECYATEKGRYNRIKNEYLPIIESAAKSFEIPKTLLACLIMRESRFNINAHAKGGGIGLGQHLRGTMTHITNLIQPMSANRLQENTETIASTLEELRKKNGTTLEQSKKDQDLAKVRLKNRMHTLGWENYYADLNKRGMHSGPTPRTVNTATLRDPQIAIGATAFYLKTILHEFRDALDQDLRVGNQDKQKPNYYLLLAAAGAYNMGPGAAIKILASIEPPDRKKWVDALAHSNEETAKHILSIRNCIESNESRRENAWQGPIGSPSYECKDGNESRIPRIETRTRTENGLPKEYESEFKTAEMKEPKPEAPPKKPKAIKAAKTQPAVKAPTTSTKKTRKKGE